MNRVIYVCILNECFNCLQIKSKIKRFFLFVRFFSDEEYEEIFKNVIRRVMDIFIDECMIFDYKCCI